MDCICHNISLVDILIKIRQEGLSSLEKLQNLDICANRCKMCVPYIQNIMKSDTITYQKTIDLGAASIQELIDKLEKLKADNIEFIQVSGQLFLETKDLDVAQKHDFY